MKDLIYIWIEKPGDFVAIAEKIGTVVFRNRMGQLSHQLWFPMEAGASKSLLICQEDPKLIDDALEPSGVKVVDAHWTLPE